MDRDVAPAHDLASFLPCDHFEHAHREGALQGVLRQEEHANAVVALFAGRDAGFLRGLFEESVRDLREDADAVADFARGVLAGPVLELLHDVQGVVEDPVVLSAVDVNYCSDAAGIVLSLVPHICILISGSFDLWGHLNGCRFLVQLFERVPLCRSTTSSFNFPRPCCPPGWGAGRLFDLWGQMTLGSNDPSAPYLSENSICS